MVISTLPLFVKNYAQLSLYKTNLTEMKRTDFLKHLFSLVGTAWLGIRISKQESYVYYEGQIAGYQYYKGPGLEKQFTVGETLELKREQTNQFDEKAVAIYYKNQQLGYVKQNENQTLSRLLDQKKELKAHIIETKTDGPSWLRVTFRVVG